MPPIALLNLGVKHPALAPKQNHHPKQKQEVRKTQQTSRCQVPPNLMAGAKRSCGDYALSWTAYPGNDSLGQSVRTPALGGFRHG